MHMDPEHTHAQQHVEQHKECEHERVVALFYTQTVKLNLYMPAESYTTLKHTRLWGGGWVRG